MPDRHEPRSTFVERLEWQIAAEARRRNRSAPAPFWVLRSRLHAAAAAAGLVIVSMTIGGAAVAASYQAQTNERRDLLIASYERRLDLARQRMALAQQQLQTVEGRIAVGVEKRENALEQRARIVQIEAEITSLELQIAEVRITGLEPREEVSAPLVDGNDFLGKRWEAEIRVPESELELASTQLRGVDRRIAVGLANSSDAAEARARVSELEAAVLGHRTKLAIRRQFLQGTISAALADLRVLEAEAEQRRAVLVPRVELARQNVAALNTRVGIGLAQPVALSTARLELAEREAELAKADLDLALVRRQIATHKEER